MKVTYFSWKLTKIQKDKHIIGFRAVTPETHLFQHKTMFYAEQTQIQVLFKRLIT
jgi:hypothetical protein